jgi:hypothetical protein
MLKTFLQTSRLLKINTALMRCTGCGQYRCKFIGGKYPNTSYSISPGHVRRSIWVLWLWSHGW